MKVLHFFSNIASQMPPTIIGLQSLGVKSRAISFGRDHIQGGDGLVRYIDLTRRSDFFYLIRSILWCNVVHWYYCVNLSDFTRGKRILFFLLFLRRKVIFEAWGSDIRMEKVALIGNEHLQQYFESTGYSPESLHAIGNEKNSLAVQRSIAAFDGKIMIPYSELIDYVDRTIFPNPYLSRVRLNLDEYQPNYVQNEIPVIVHAPTNKAIKGSDFIADAIELLKKEGFRINFVQIYDMPHHDAMNIVREADILIDQIIIGDVGVVAREAMAFGKIAIGYLTERVKKIYGEEFPLVEADRYSLKDVLASLLRDPKRMREIRLKSRQYVEKHHDCKKVALEIYKAYKEN